MCKRLMGNLGLLGSVRSVYSHPSGFNYHQTKKHKVQSSLPDVIKGMWFCLRNAFFQMSLGDIPLEFPMQNTSGIQKKVAKSLIGVVEKGEQKVREKFEAKLHESFPLFRSVLLESVLEEH
jgi:hypothetical protein